MPTRYLGNMVIAMQALAALLDRYNDEMVLAVDETYRDLLGLAFGSTPRMLYYPRGAIGKGNLVSRARRFMGFIKALRHETFDCALDMDGTVVSGRLARLCRAREKIGPGFAKRQSAYTRLVPMDKDAQHCFDDFSLLIQALGVSVRCEAYYRIPAASDDYWDDVHADVAGAMSGGQRPLACIHPCATKDYKQWDIDKFADLADRLMTSGWQVVLIGAGAAEARRIEVMLAQMQHTPINAHGKLSLTQLVYLFQHARVFIGNDSGPMHLAAASGTDVIALFGPTELIRWQPRSERVHVIKGIEPCSPDCRPEACLYAYRCLRSLSVSQAEEAITTIG